MIYLIDKKLKDVNRNTAIFALIILSFSAYGFTAFNILLFGDDWRLVVNPNDMDVWVSKLGRWGQALYRKIFLLDSTFPPSASIILSIALLCISGCLLIMTIGGGNLTTINLIYFCALFVFCPILITIFNFNLIRVPFAIGVLLVSFIFFYIKEVIFCKETRYKNIVTISVVSIIALIFAISIRQSILLVYIMIFQLTIISIILDDNKEFNLVKYTMTMASILLFSLIGYFIMHKILMNAFSFAPIERQSYSMTKSLVNSPSELFSNVVRAFYKIKRYMLSESSYWPLITKKIFIVSYLIFFVLAISSMVKTKKRVTYIILFILLNITIIYTPYLLGIIRDNSINNAYKETSLTSIILIYPSIYILLNNLLTNKKLRIILYIAFGYIILQWIFQINSSSLVQHFINQRDLVLHNRIVSRIEQSEEFERFDSLKDLKLVYIQSIPFKSNSKNNIFDNRRGVIHCGIFNCQVGRVNNLFNLTEYGGGKYDVESISYKDKKVALNWIPKDSSLDKTKLEAIINEMRPWPSSKAIKFYDKIVFIKLSEPN